VGISSSQSLRDNRVVQNMYRQKTYILLPTRLCLGIATAIPIGANVECAGIGAIDA